MSCFETKGCVAVNFNGVLACWRIVDVQLVSHCIQLMICKNSQMAVIYFYWAQIELKIFTFM